MNRNRVMVGGKCNCGKEGRYTYGITQELSCNKYSVCLTYEELLIELKAVEKESKKYKEALEKIVRVNAMDYEYKSWAKEALAAPIN